MRHQEVTLDDKFLLTDGRVFITGVQTLLRVLIDQHRLDRSRWPPDRRASCRAIAARRWADWTSRPARAGKYPEGRRGGLQAKGLNEDLAATAVWGSQQANLFDTGATLRRRVYGMWYGKAPGGRPHGRRLQARQLRRNLQPKGGVLAVAGDDHNCKSSTLPSQSEYAFQDFEMPVLSPADVQEVLDYGLLGYAMSRFSGLWVG